MTEPQATGPTPEQIADLETWADEGDFAGIEHGTILRGAQAAEAGRAMLAAAGLDVEAFERSTAGRPRLDPTGPKGVRSPRVNVAIPEALDTALKTYAQAHGVRSSTVVRDALAAYLTTHAAS